MASTMRNCSPVIVRKLYIRSYQIGIRIGLKMPTSVLFRWIWLVSTKPGHFLCLRSFKLVYVVYNYRRYSNSCQFLIPLRMNNASRGSSSRLSSNLSILMCAISGCSLSLIRRSMTKLPKWFSTMECHSCSRGMSVWLSVRNRINRKMRVFYELLVSIAPWKDLRMGKSCLLELHYRELSSLYRILELHYDHLKAWPYR